MVPIVHVIVLFRIWQEPRVDCAEITEKEGGRESIKTTLVAEDGPLFVSTMVKVVLLETSREVGFALWAKLKSALAITRELAEAELFAGIGSTAAELVTLAVFKIVELFGGALSVTMTIAKALLARVPKLNPIPPLDKLVVPEIVVAET